jgi:hypothetical protein
MIYVDLENQLDTIWEALHDFRCEVIPEGNGAFDEQWDNICYAMAVIKENLEISEENT